MFRVVHRPYADPPRSDRAGYPWAWQERQRGRGILARVEFAELGVQQLALALAWFGPDLVLRAGRVNLRRQGRRLAKPCSQADRCSRRSNRGMVPGFSSVVCFERGGVVRSTMQEGSLLPAGQRGDRRVETTPRAAGRAPLQCDSADTGPSARAQHLVICWQTHAANDIIPRAGLGPWLLSRLGR